MMDDTATILILAVEDRQGYSPAQVAERYQLMTLFDLKRAVEEAIEDFGDDAVIVTDNGDRYGARFGALDVYRDTFVPVEDDEEDDDDE